MGRAMALYIFIFHFDDEGAAVQRAELEFDNEFDALEAAENLAEHYKVDVWQGERLVAQVERDDEALKVKGAGAH
jgi:hypothetical protein